MEVNERESQQHVKAIAPIISQAYQFGKQGLHDEAFHLLLPYLERNEIPQYFCQPAGWTIYRFIKAHMSQLQPSQFRTIFDYYFGFCEKKPSLVHSYIMVLAINFHKLHRMEFSLSEFCQKWGLSNFMPEDFKSTHVVNMEGKNITFQSLGVKVATALYKELKACHTKDTAQDVLPFFETVRELCPEYEFPPLYIANLYAWTENYDKAKKMFKDMLTKTPKWYLWQAFGNLLDCQLKLSCYCKALTMVDKEDYAGELHLTLAAMLTNTDKSHAAAELSKYVSTYHRNGWKLRPEAYEIEKALCNITSATDSFSFYEDKSQLAEDLVYQDFPQEEFVYLGNKTNKKGKNMAWLKTMNKPSTNHIKSLSIFIPCKSLPKNASIGDIFMCRYKTCVNRPAIIMTIRSANRHVSVKAPDEQTTIESTGVVHKRDDQPYAFINNYFVPPKLCQLAKLTNGQKAKFIAKQQPDGRFRVIKILTVGSDNNIR